MLSSALAATVGIQPAMHKAAVRPASVRFITLCFFSNFNYLRFQLIIFSTPECCQGNAVRSLHSCSYRKSYISVPRIFAANIIYTFRGNDFFDVIIHKYMGRRMCVLHKICKQMLYKNVIRWLFGASLVYSSNINDYITALFLMQAFLLTFYILPMILLKLNIHKIVS
jgi:hypothetical protein